MYRVALVRTHRGTLYKWSKQKCTGLHWYAHTEGRCTNGASRSNTQRDAEQMHQAEVYRVTLVCTHRGTLYKWSRQKCTGLHWYAHTEGCCTDGAGRSVQVTLVRTHKGVLYKWSRRKCTGLVHGHGMRRTEKERTRRTVKSRASPRDCFLFFRLDKVRVPYESGSTSCEKCPLTCKDGLCGKI